MAPHWAPPGVTVAETAEPEGVEPSAIVICHRCRFNPFRVGSRIPVYGGLRSARLRSAHGYSHSSPPGTKGDAVSEPNSWDMSSVPARERDEGERAIAS